jgi:hypothetical protein
VDNALIESLWSTIQRELLERHEGSRTGLASAIFEWIEGWTTPPAGTARWACCPRATSKPVTPLAIPAA